MEQTTSTLTIQHAAVVIPAICGIARAARVGLNARIALQQSAPKIVEPTAAAQKCSRAAKFVIVTIAIITSVCMAAQFGLIPWGGVLDRVSPKTILCAWMFMIFQSSVLLVALRGSGLISATVRNVVGSAPRIALTPNGEPGSKARRGKIFLIALATSAFTGAALYTENSVLLSLASLTLYVNIGYFPPFKSLSIRALALYGLCVEVGLIAFSAVLATALVAMEYQDKEGQTIPIESTASPFGDFGNTYPAFVAFLVPTWFRWQSVLISTCLRFDYQQHLVRSGETAPTFATHATSGDVILPLRGVRRFRSPYFIVTLFATIGTFVCLSIHTDFDDLTFAIVAAMLAYPAACLALGFTALLRREFKAVWTYRESYVCEVGKILLPIEVEVDHKEAEDEAVPAYEEVVVKADE